MISTVQPKHSRQGVLFVLLKQPPCPTKKASATHQLETLREIPPPPPLVNFIYTKSCYTSTRNYGTIQILQYSSHTVGASLYGTPPYCIREMREKRQTVFSWTKKKANRCDGTKVLGRRLTSTTALWRGGTSGDADDVTPRIVSDTGGKFSLEMYTLLSRFFFNANL